jgi:hypothetical protein
MQRYGDMVALKIGRNEHRGRVVFNGSNVGTMPAEMRNPREMSNGK